MTKFRISKYYVVFIYFQSAVSGLLAVSVLYIEKKSKQILHNNLEIRDFVTCQIAFLMRYFKHWSRI